VGETLRRSISGQDSCSLANSEKLITEEVGKGDGVVETDTSDTSDTSDTHLRHLNFRGRRQLWIRRGFWRRTGEIVSHYICSSRRMAEIIGEFRDIG